MMGKSLFARAGRGALSVWSIPLALVLFLSVNVIASLRFDDARLDLTEEGIYTLSDSTRAVLEAVQEPITLRLFASSALIEEVPAMRVYFDRVSELLRAYERISDSRVRIERVDPLPFSTAEDKAIGYNLVGVNLNRVGEQGYFGLVGTNAVDQLEIIPIMSPARERFLEYELTRAVMRLSSPTEPRVGVIDGLGLFGDFEARRQPAAIIDRLGDDFALVPIDQDAKEIPADLHALVVIHPHSMTPEALFAVDQYALRGGPLVVFVDPLSEHSPPDPENQTRPQYPNSTLDPLFAAWGINFDPTRVVGDMDMGLPVRAQAGNQIAMTKYLPWLVVDQDNLGQDDAVTNRLNLMRLSTAGAIEQRPDASTKVSPLILSTAATMLIDQSVLMRREDPRRLLDSFVNSQTTRMMAVRITGPAKTAYPDGNPAGGATPTTQSVDGVNIIVVADADMLADNLNVNRDGVPVTQNGDFVVNAIDSLAGGGALHELRGRSITFRPFTLVNELEAAAQARYRDTEQRLQAELRETQERLASLRTNVVDSQVVVLTPEQQREIAEFNGRIVEIRTELRRVQGALRADVESLTSWLRMANIIAVPALIVLVGLIIAILRRVRLSRFLRTTRTRQEA